VVFKHFRIESNVILIDIQMFEATDIENKQESRGYYRIGKENGHMK
jgi:hypothetical protein